MADSRIKPAEMYGITRSISKRNDKSLCWKVTISRRGIRFCKSFHDQTWEGAENALAAAKRYRDATVQRIPPLTIREFAQKLKANNTSGFVGVYPGQSRSGVRIWRACIKLPSGKSVSKSFAESVHGPRARELAIQARQQLLDLLEETNTLTHSPGAIAEANPAEFSTALPRPPRTLTVRVQRLGNNGGTPNKYIYTSVSDAISSRVQKTFSTGAHGQAGAFRLAMQAALTVVTQLGGEEAAQIFMRDYVEKYKRLPKKGVSARIRFMSVEDSMNHGMAKRSLGKKDATLSV